MSFTALPTNYGREWNARAMAGEAVSPITKMAFGDSNRVVAGGENALGNEVHRVTISAHGIVDGETAAYFDGPLPQGVGGFVIREVGLFTEDGKLVAIGTRDPGLPITNQDDLTYRFEVFYDQLDALVVQIDPVHGITAETILQHIPPLPINRQLRPDFRSAEQFANNPPADPQAGQTWIVGAYPAGAFVGHEHELAEWSGTGWTFAAPTPWMLIGLGDRTDWRWDHTLDVPAWVRWKATGAIAGPIVLDDTIRLIQIYPEIVETGNRFALTAAAGEIVIDADQKWIWRGHHFFNTDDFDLADRTFATAANKTYHLRWHAPNTGIAVPEADYPYGRFELADLTGSSPAENDPQYDTSYDRMLIARIVTNGANAATVTALANAITLSQTASITFSYGEFPFPHVSTALNWARTPKVTFPYINTIQPNYVDTISYFGGEQTTRYLGAGSAFGYNRWDNNDTWYTSRPEFVVQWEI
jgi:hypothetical protein